MKKVTKEQRISRLIAECNTGKEYLKVTGIDSIENIFEGVISFDIDDAEKLKAELQSCIDTIKKITEVIKSSL